MCVSCSFLQTIGIIQLLQHYCNNFSANIAFIFPFKSKSIKSCYLIPHAIFVLTVLVTLFEKPKHSLATLCITYCSIVIHSIALHIFYWRHFQ